MNDSHALFLTAYDRLDYLRDTLASWRKVRGFYQWPLYAMIEPSPVQQQVLDILDELQHPNMHVSVNPQVYGVLHHPWVGFKRLFDHYDFIVRIEDDLIVSEDVLEYFEWAEKEFKHDHHVASVHGFTRENGEADVAHRIVKFDSWIWGTWADRWKSFMEETWDHDYSTFNGWPGHESGWDWNLSTRVYPQFQFHGIFPASSRVQNIGVSGTHAQAADYQYTLSPSYRAEREPVSYRQV